MLLCTLTLVAQKQPSFGILENVYGFSMPERKGAPSPLTNFREYIKTAQSGIQNYIMTVMVFPGNIHSTSVRRRLYLVLIKNNDGQGELKAEHIKTLSKARRSFLCSVSPAQLSPVQVVRSTDSGTE